MNKINMLIAILFFITGCNSHLQAENPQNTEKINARILLYVSDSFKNYQSSPATVIRTLLFKFNEPVTKLLPALFNNTFVKVDFTDTKIDIVDNYDFLAAPKFENVTFDSDRTFGHELRVNVSIEFKPANNSDPIIIKGTGLGKDIYGGRTIYEQNLANQAFADVIKELQRNIQNKRSDFENNVLF